MENIVEIKGHVKYKITLDPSVWIFDDRKADLDSFFEKLAEKDNELDEYTKSISKHWDREIIEGASVPQKGNTNKKFIKETLLTGTFGIPFEPFLQNSEPFHDAKTIVIETVDHEYPFAIERANDMILCFSNQGKPLKEDGPIHLYFQDGSNKDRPIRNINSFRIE
jgi:hypothetical protein